MHKLVSSFKFRLLHMNFEDYTCIPLLVITSSEETQKNCALRRSLKIQQDIYRHFK